MSNQQRVNCRICRHESPTNGKVCLGCGTPVANARAHPSKKKNQKPKCPQCRRDQSYEQLGFLVCKACGAHFEDDDFTFVDTRPDVNAMKKERK